MFCLFFSSHEGIAQKPENNAALYKELDPKAVKNEYAKLEQLYNGSSRTSSRSIPRKFIAVNSLLRRLVSGRRRIRSTNTQYYTFWVRNRCSTLRKGRSSGIAWEAFGNERLPCPMFTLFQRYSTPSTRQGSFFHTPSTLFPHAVLSPQHNSLRFRHLSALLRLGTHGVPFCLGASVPFFVFVTHNFSVPVQSFCPRAFNTIYTPPARHQLW